MTYRASCSVQNACNASALTACEFTTQIECLAFAISALFRATIVLQFSPAWEPTLLRTKYLACNASCRSVAIRRLRQISEAAADYSRRSAKPRLRLNEDERKMLKAMERDLRARLALPHRARTPKCLSDGPNRDQPTRLRSDRPDAPARQRRLRGRGQRARRLTLPSLSRAQRHVSRPARGRRDMPNTQARLREMMQSRMGN
jgi:hypothetical protein